jgi:hypothetical protein
MNFQLPEYPKVFEITMSAELSNNANVVFTYKSVTSDFRIAIRGAVLFAEDKFNAKVVKYDILEVITQGVQH